MTALEEYLRDGENSLVEFKSEQVHPDSLAKAIVAFANMAGGEILIGVEDDGRVSGVNDPTLADKIIVIYRNNIAPPLIPVITSTEFQGKRIYYIAVSKGLYKPYKVKTTNKFYIRAGATSVEPTNEELIRLFQDGQQRHFEISPIPGTALADVDLLKFRAYCTDFRTIDVDDQERERLLYNLQILTREGNLTIAGLLFFGKEIVRFLPQAGIELHSFAGDDVTSDILDSKIVVSDIPAAIAAAEDFVTFHSQKRSYFNAAETRRTDRYDFEPFVVRELVVNAFAHRDWSIFGQKIRIAIFHDRLELFSPGKLPNTINLENALSGVSYYRNPIIAQWLHDYRLSEKLGRGLFKMMKFYKANQLPAPQFVADPTYFKVILSNANLSA